MEKLGILLVIDESHYSAGRLPRHAVTYGVKPDLAVMGKMIGGGVSPGALGGDGKYLSMNSSGQAYHSGTYHGHRNNHPLYFYGARSHLGYESPDHTGRRYRSCRDIPTYTNQEAMYIFAVEIANREIYPMYRGPPFRDR